MPPTRRAEHAGLIGNRAREAAAAMAEQLAVGQLARSAGAVVGQEHTAAPRRAGVNGAGDEILAGAAFAGDENREVVALHALNLLGDTLHGGAGADEAGQQRLQRTLDDAAGRLDRAVAGGAQIESLAQHCTQRPEALRARLPENGRGLETSAKRGPSWSRPSGSIVSRGRRRRRQRRGWRPSPIARALVGIAPGREASTRTAVPHWTKTTAASASHASSSAVAPSRASSAGHHGGINDAADQRIVAIHLDADVAAGRRRGGVRPARGRASARSGAAPSASKIATRVVQIACRPGSRAG